jgi:hypothetical protein
MSGEWWAADLAHTLGMGRSLLHTWIQRGRVQARQEAQGMHRWIVQADPPTLERLQQYRQRDIASDIRSRWTQAHRTPTPRGED